MCSGMFWFIQTIIFNRKLFFQEIFNLLEYTKKQSRIGAPAQAPTCCELGQKECLTSQKNSSAEYSLGIFAVFWVCLFVSATQNPFSFFLTISRDANRTSHTRGCASSCTQAPLVCSLLPPPPTWSCTTQNVRSPRWLGASLLNASSFWSSWRE